MDHRHQAEGAVQLVMMMEPVAPEPEAVPVSKCLVLSGTGLDDEATRGRGLIVASGIRRLYALGQLLGLGGGASKRRCLFIFAVTLALLCSSLLPMADSGIAPRGSDIRSTVSAFQAGCFLSAGDLSTRFGSAMRRRPYCTALKRREVRGLRSDTGVLGLRSDTYADRYDLCVFFGYDLQSCMQTKMKNQFVRI